MLVIPWDLAMTTAKRMAPLRQRYVSSQRHNDVASQLNMLLANREMSLAPVKSDRKLGLLVVGATGAGKTTLLGQLQREHPYLVKRDERHLPLVSLRITAPVTNKSLAHQTLQALGFNSDFDPKISAHKYWGWVRAHAEARNVFGFIFDEGQDLFLKASNAEAREALSMMKGLMEIPGHPYVLIMSGGPELERFIEMDPMVSERFYRAVLTPINPDRACKALVPEMKIFAKQAGMEFGSDIEHIARRTIHASFNQFGRSLELTVDGIQEAAYAGAGKITMTMFADAYHRHTHCGPGQNIFLSDQWQSLSPIKITMDHVGAVAGKATTQVEKREDSIW